MPRAYKSMVRWLDEMYKNQGLEDCDSQIANEGADIEQHKNLVKENMRKWPS